MKSDAKVKDKDYDPKDEMYHELAQMDGWVQLKAYIDSRKQTLKSMVEIDMEQKNLDLEEIGLRFMIVDLAVGELDEIVRQVERSSEFIDTDGDSKGSTAK